MFGFILILVLLSFGCSEHSSNPVQSVSVTQPAGKSNEALGFDFRINHNGWLWDEEKIPYEYSMEIRRGGPTMGECNCMESFFKAFGYV